VVEIKKIFQSTSYGCLTRKKFVSQPHENEKLYVNNLSEKYFPTKSICTRNLHTTKVGGYMKGVRSGLLEKTEYLSRWFGGFLAKGSVSAPFMLRSLKEYAVAIWSIP
jgi:hypothetical protein